MNVLYLAAGLLIGACLAMAAAWGVSERTGRSGWADTVWSFAVGGLGVMAALAPVSGREVSERQLLVACLAAAWSLRLGLHIARRTAAGPEDARYAWLRGQWGARAPSRLFWFLQVQAVAAFLLAGCMGLAAHRPGPIGAGDVLGIALLVLAVAGAGRADDQLRRFKADPANAGRICDSGLWAFSRHPNYFFEWLGWWGYAAIAIDPTGGYFAGWLALAGPAFMYWLLVHVSGIPPLEAHLHRSRGAAFAAYRDSVSAFWPWPRRPFGNGDGEGAA
ncbi:DUF1295 domain-containing protein [Radicibacter daui]|uniref:DUF1295 domain-containing protein n=1 Tax=Radicibacter daui TaxID=3064829 RepID=UPI004046FECF